jgi:site-specific recombinase XerD
LGLALAAEQSSHVLRHTLASQFIMNSGNILMLQKFLRPMALAMTMLYAHLLPDHLKDAVRFGPASDFRHFFDS